MFFTTAISKKLVSLLRPWLQQEPELELKLGPFRSNGIAKNLCFDTSVLNQLIDDFPGFSLKEVRVDHLSFQLSFCSFPALTIDVRGVHVTLSGGWATENLALLFSVKLIDFFGFGEGNWRRKDVGNQEIRIRRISRRFWRWLIQRWMVKSL